MSAADVPEVSRERFGRNPLEAKLFIKCSQLSPAGKVKRPRVILDLRHLFNISSRTERVRLGSALPRIWRMTCPTNQPIRLTFPDL